MAAPLTVFITPLPGVDLPPAVHHFRETVGASCEIVTVAEGISALNAAIAARPGHDFVIASAGVRALVPDWLPRLRSRLEADAKLGAVSAKYFDRMGLIYSFGRSIVSIFGMREHLTNVGYGESDAEKYGDLTEADAVLPWLVCVRREAFDAAGGFDEALAGVPVSGPGRPAWLESDDLCIALRAKGFSVASDPEVPAFHGLANTYQAIQEVQSKTAFPEIDERIANLWRKKWRWNPNYPDLHAVRERWLDTAICWRIGKTLQDDWGSDAPPVDLLLVTRNNLKLLAPMLDSLGRTSYRNARLLVHLNGSTDGTKAHLEKLQKDGYPFPIVLADSPVNLGYTPAVNWLFSLSTAPLLAKLDDDVELPADWLEKMIARLRAHPYAGVVGAKIVNFDDPKKFLWADYRLWPTAHNHQGEEDKGQYDFLSRTLANMGCAMLYRRKAWVKAGPYDIGLNPVAWDDLDHQIALWNAGYDVLCDGTISVKHPLKRLRDHCRRVASNMQGNGTKVTLKWGHGAFQVIDRNLDLAGRKL